MLLPALICMSLPVPTADAPSQTVLLANFGVGDTLFIVVIALIVFGPKKLPEISRQVGKLLYEFRKASNDFKFQIEEELRASEQAERQKQLNTQAAAPQPASAVALSATETVTAGPVAEVAPLATGSPESLSVQPPSTGLPVSSRSPYRPAAEKTESSGESTEEQQVNAQEAIASNEAAQTGEGSNEIQPVPTHHG